MAGQRFVLLGFFRWVIKGENGKLVPLFLFGLTGDGSGGADVCIKPRLFPGHCRLPRFLFAEAPGEFSRGFSPGGSWSRARTPRGPRSRVPSLASSLSRGSQNHRMV